MDQPRNRQAPGSDDFQPLPLLGNPHLQTLLGTWLQGSPFSIPTRRHRVTLPDGDRLVLYDSVPGRWHPGQHVALLVHGLLGDHRSGYMKRLGGLLWQRGLRVVRMDLRGCGGGIGLARRTYHAGSSEDVRAALAEMRRWSPASPLVMVGFSLGGNIVLKLAGEARDHPVPGLAGVAAVAPPIDLERSADLLALPRNRFYEQHFTRGMMALARRRQQLFRERPAFRFPPRMTLRLFDDLYTAPRSGFADARDYYRRAAALPLIPRIPVPGLIVAARDDPFVACEPFESLSVPPHVEVRLLARGGHVGFLGWDGAGGIRWAERRVAEWVLGRMKDESV